MGITGLLKVLEPICSDFHLKDLKGRIVAVDGLCWLHKGIYACSFELACGIKTDKHITFCMNRTKMLQHFGVIPLIVFDGDALPSKKGTEIERKTRRDEAKAKGNELLQKGDKVGANKFFSRAIDVSSQMIFEWIKELKELGVDFIVAPYEADAQLAFLSINNLCAAVLTEDSDLIAFGAKRVIVKLDNNGFAKQYEFNKLSSHPDLDFKSWDLEMFLNMCILSGCDYLPSLQGMGIKNAHKYVLKYKTNIARMFQMIRLDGKFLMPKDYETNFNKARLTFKHQRVWNPRSQEITELTPLPEGVAFDSIDFAGPQLPQDTALLICTGQIDSHSKLPFPFPKNNESNTLKSTATSITTTASSSFEIKLPKTPPSNIHAAKEDDFIFEKNEVKKNLKSIITPKRKKTCSITSNGGQGIKQYLIKQSTSPSTLHQFKAPRLESAKSLTTTKKRASVMMVPPPVDSSLVVPDSRNPFTNTITSLSVSSKYFKTSLPREEGSVSKSSSIIEASEGKENFVPMHNQSYDDDDDDGVVNSPVKGKRNPDFNPFEVHKSRSNTSIKSRSRSSIGNTFKPQNVGANFSTLKRRNIKESTIFEPENQGGNIYKKFTTPILSLVRKGSNEVEEEEEDKGSSNKRSYDDMLNSSPLNDEGSIFANSWRSTAFQNDNFNNNRTNFFVPESPEMESRPSSPKRSFTMPPISNSVLYKTIISTP